MPSMINTETGRAGLQRAKSSRPIVAATTAIAEILSSSSQPSRCDIEAAVQDARRKCPIAFFCAKREGPEWQQVVSEYHGPEFVGIACNDKSLGKSRRYLPLQNGMGLAYGPDVTTRLHQRDEIVTKQQKVVTGRSV